MKELIFHSTVTLPFPIVKSRSLTLFSRGLPITSRVFSSKRAFFFFFYSDAKEKEKRGEERKDAICSASLFTWIHLTLNNSKDQSSFSLLYCVECDLLYLALLLLLLLLLLKITICITQGTGEKERENVYSFSWFQFNFVPRGK